MKRFEPPSRGHLSKAHCWNKAAALIAALALAGCGGSKSSSPTAPTATSTRVISIDGSLAFGDVTIGQSKEMTIAVRNSGTGPLTLSTVTGPTAVMNILSVTGTNQTVAPGGSQSLTLRLTPATSGSISGTIIVNADHTSGTNTVTLTANGVPAPTPSITVTGIVTDSNSRRPLSGVRVAALTSAVLNVGETRTDGNGFYSVVVPSATALSVSYALQGYNFSSSTVTFTSDTRRDVALLPFWTLSGTGNTVFDMPSYVSRVRITGRYDSNSSNFIVRVGGRLVVNELLGRAWNATTYNGLHLVSGGVTEITNSRDVAWTFTQEQ